MIACFNLCISVLSGLSGLSVCVSVCVFLVFPCLRLFVNLSALTGEIKISIYYNFRHTLVPYCYFIHHLQVADDTVVLNNASAHRPLSAFKHKKSTVSTTPL